MTDAELELTEFKLTDTARFLFEQKVACVNTIGNVCMSWWVSSVVFYGTALGVVWWKRDLLTGFKALLLFGGILLAFFAGVVFYGITFIIYIHRVHKQVFAFTERLGYDDFFGNELSTFKLAMIIGTASLGTILFALVILWSWLLFAKLGLHSLYSFIPNLKL